MKFLTDFFPILLFFIAYKMYDIYVATAVAIASSAIQVGFAWFRHRKVEKMHLITLLLLVVFGGMTLLLRDPVFIKWKPTVVNILFGMAFIGSQFIGEKNIIERMMGHAVELPSIAWTRLNMAWSLFFFAMAATNLFVAYNFSEETWVNFKLFGMLGMTFLFVIIQSIYIARHIQEQPPATEES
ncbi:MAG: septation protein A [Sedimenticola sp.]|jgi:intracellular septation protein|nr:MAG: septation protein A [Sedimenticola sp.]